MNASAARDRLEAARTALVVDRPFLGVLALRLPLTEAEPAWCPTLATDARTLYFNPVYVTQLSLDQAQFMLAHEALHCALGHFARRGHRLAARWDAACDLAVNALLVEDGLTPPAGAAVAPEWAGLDAETIYARLGDGHRYQILDRHLYRGAGEAQPPDPPPNEGTQGRRNAGPGEAAEAAGMPRALTPGEAEQLARRWRHAVAGALQQAEQAGRLPGLWRRQLGDRLAPQVPWRAVLARFLNALGRADYSYTRPPRREGPAVLPTLSRGHPELVVALDTSASISAERLGAFVTELDALKAQLDARVTVHACDARLAADGPWVYEPWEPLALPRGLHGGGGTRFTPVFDWLEHSGHRPNCLLYFTDGQGAFPPDPPDYPVGWVVPEDVAVPWGDRIPL